MIFRREITNEEQIVKFASKAVIPQIWHHVTIFVLEIKNEVERKQFNTILDIQKASIEAVLTISKKRTFSGVFLKLYDRRKHCISSEGYFEWLWIKIYNYYFTK